MSLKVLKRILRRLNSRVIPEGWGSASASASSGGILKRPVLWRKSELSIIPKDKNMRNCDNGEFNENNQFRKRFLDFGINLPLTDGVMASGGSSSHKQPFTIVVEGNIGSGKTTFLQHFKQYSDKVAVFDEPVKKWQDVQGHNLLDLMYKDPVKWSLCFQSYVQLTMLDLHTKPVTQPIKLMERSIFSAKYCFVNNLKEQGFLADSEYTVLNEWFNFIRDSIPLKVDLIVYLRTDPEVVYSRICERGRSEENSISLEYLKSVHNLHEDWLQNNKYHVPAPVVVYDANEDLNAMAQNYTLCEDTIFKKVAVAN